MNCSHCGEPIADACQGHPAGPYDAMGETVYCDGSCESKPLCTDCADLYDALLETGAFDAEGCTENAFFTTGEANNV